MEDAAAPASTFTNPQLVELDDRIQNQSAVQYLLCQVGELRTELDGLKSRILELEQQVAKKKDRAKTFMIDPDAVPHLPGKPADDFLEVSACVGKYLSFTANAGLAARRLKTGEIVVDLGHPDIHPYLPLDATPAALYESARAATRNGRRRTRRLHELDRAEMKWEQFRPLAMVMLP